MPFGWGNPRLSPKITRDWYSLYGALVPPRLGSCLRGLSLALELPAEHLENVAFQQPVAKAGRASRGEPREVARQVQFEIIFTRETQRKIKTSRNLINNIGTHLICS